MIGQETRRQNHPIRCLGSSGSCLGCLGELAGPGVITTRAEAAMLLTKYGTKIEGLECNYRKDSQNLQVNQEREDTNMAISIDFDVILSDDYSLLVVV